MNERHPTRLPASRPFDDNRGTWPEPQKTEELLAGAREGDASAVNQLMERHRDSLRRIVQDAARLGRQRHSAVARGRSNQQSRAS